MNILLVLIPVTLLVVLAGLALFFWAVNHQQFEDLDSPAMLPLLDNPEPDASTPITPLASVHPLPQSSPLRAEEAARSVECPSPLPVGEKGWGERTGRPNTCMK
jgi:cbb3-type cytochrome oxidase maturation protein